MAHDGSAGVSPEGWLPDRVSVGALTRAFPPELVDRIVATTDTRELLALAALVRCVEDERCSASFPHAFPAVLRVTTRTGEELEARVEVNRGGPGNPLSDEELARKFHDNAVRSLPEERAAEIAARTLALPDAQSVEDLTALLTSAGER